MSEYRIGNAGYTLTDVFAGLVSLSIIILSMLIVCSRINPSAGNNYINSKHDELMKQMENLLADKTEDVSAEWGNLTSVPSNGGTVHSSLNFSDKNSCNIFSPSQICRSDNRGDWITVSGLCHLLMFYQLGKTDLAEFPGGVDMLRALTDETTAIKVFGKSPFVRTQNGIRYFLSKESAFYNSGVGEVHRDQCLATFAGLNLPLNTPLKLRSGTYSIKDLFSEMIANYDVNQAEPAWTAMAMAK